MTGGATRLDDLLTQRYDFTIEDLVNGTATLDTNNWFLRYQQSVREETNG
jgi:hypothetical protein